MTDEKDPKNTDENLETSLEQEIKEAKESLKQEASVNAYKQGKDDAIKEQKISEMEAQLAEANRKLEEAEAAQKKRIQEIDDKYSSKMDELLAKSKQTIQGKDPFKEGDPANVESLSDEQINQIEDNSREEFIEFFSQRK